MEIQIKDLDFEKGNGLITVVAQCVTTKEVLMVAWANKEAVERTAETGSAVFWSRSRQKLWPKGEESGNIMKVCQIWVDCDRDTLIYLVFPAGPACHNGTRTCFNDYLKLSDDLIGGLEH
jgi:phosphoribosyl-AMP cyclohydrolase